MKIIDRGDPINLIGGIYTKNNSRYGNEMIVKIVGILEDKDNMIKYFILDVLTSTEELCLNTLYNYISGPYHRNTLLNFNGSIMNKYRFEICDNFHNNYTKKT